MDCEITRVLPPPPPPPPPDNRHEVGIAVPAGHDVHVQVAGQARAGTPAEVHPHVEAVGGGRLLEQPAWRRGWCGSSRRGTPRSARQDRPGGPGGAISRWPLLYGNWLNTVRHVRPRQITWCSPSLLGLAGVSAEKTPAIVLVGQTADVFQSPGCPKILVLFGHDEPESTGRAHAGQALHRAANRLRLCRHDNDQTALRTWVYDRWASRVAALVARTGDCRAGRRRRMPPGRSTFRPPK